jgi:hypothetical protein
VDAGSQPSLVFRRDCRHRISAGRTGGRYEKSEGVAMLKLLHIGGFEEMNGPRFNDTFRNGCHYSRSRRFIRGVVSFRCTVPILPCCSVHW